MPSPITIDAHQVFDALNRLRNQAEDLTPALNAIGGSLKSKIQLGFRSSTSPSGQRWAPLKFRQGQPLVDRGNLRDSIDSR
jgi:phage gpG-like protein